MTTDRQRQAAAEKQRQAEQPKPFRRRTKATKADELLFAEFEVIVDSNEDHPWTFQGITSSARQGSRELIIKTHRKRLETGDYSIVGHETEIAIERKSLEDLYGTVAGRRENFEKEHQRMQQILSFGGVAAVVIEASLDKALDDAPMYTSYKPTALLGTWVWWQMRYGVPWCWCGTRAHAELVCYRMLDAFWRDRNMTIPEHTLGLHLEEQDSELAG